MSAVQLEILDLFLFRIEYNEEIGHDKSIADRIMHAYMANVTRRLLLFILYVDWRYESKRGKHTHMSIYIN